jgi:hypothetical protein
MKFKSIIGVAALIVSTLSPVASHAQADLAVTGVRFSPNPIHPWDMITTTVTVSNVSSFDYTKQFLVDVQGSVFAVDSLASGAVTNVALTAFSFGSPGTATLNFGIIAGDENQDNNWIAATLTIVPDPSKPYVLIAWPNGGEQLMVGQTYTINTVTNLLPAGTSVLLLLDYQGPNDVPGGGEMFEDVIGIYAGGQYKWTVPAKYASSSFDPSTFQIHAVLVGPGISPVQTPEDYSEYFTVAPQPYSLTVTKDTVNGSPVYQLNGMAGYNYSVQASTNLTDWTTIETLYNTNGTVSFYDKDSTNYPARFYRGVAHY